MKQIQIFVRDTNKDLASAVNDFCKTHSVFDVTFYPESDNHFPTAMIIYWSDEQ